MLTRTITKNVLSIDAVLMAKGVIDGLRKNHADNFPYAELMNLEIASDCLADVKESYDRRDTVMQEVEVYGRP